jgi:hypothetical protein
MTALTLEADLAGSRRDVSCVAKLGHYGPRGLGPRDFAKRDLWNVGASFRPDAGKPDHLAPLLDFIGYELSKVGGGARKHRSSQIGKAFLHVGIGKSGIDLLVELLNNVCGRGFGHDDPIPASRMMSGEPPAGLVTIKRIGRAG